MATSPAMAARRLPRRTSTRWPRAAEFRPQLYHTHDDPAETKDVSAAHPEMVQELRALLTRYREWRLQPRAAADAVGFGKIMGSSN